MGSVYFIQAVTGGPIKIGYAVDAQGRARVLQTGSAVRLEVICTVDGTPALEREFHRAFASSVMEGEWFAPSDAIRTKVKELGGVLFEERPWAPADKVATSANLTRGGAAVQSRLDELGHTQAWLVGQINDIRAARGIKGRAAPVTVWRWMSGFSRIGLDDALVIRRILGVQIETWSQYEDVALDTTSS